MSEQKLIAKMKGYKATNSDMTCNPTGSKPFTYEIGVWYEHEGDLDLCGAGFHFCPQPSGPWCYYSSPGTRVFEVEAESILDLPVGPGADFKMVCLRIRLVREIILGGDQNMGNWNTGDQNTGSQNTGDQNTGSQNTGSQNTGNQNTGDRNTGNWNTGSRNTGNWNAGNQNTGDQNTGDQNTGDQNTGSQNTGNQNTGDRNTGNWNTGSRNTGYRNTGNWNTGNWNAGDQNTGDRNTGYWNTGYWNTGYRNTGYWNTGYQNTGNRNTGDWNATNRSAGYFCVKEPSIICFDVNTRLSDDEFQSKHGSLCSDLGYYLSKNSEIPFDRFSSIPGITKSKLKALHAKMKAARKS